MLLDRTCFLAKTMGLHQQRQTDTSTSNGDIQARRFLFWLLFTLDKDLSILLGSPPSLPLYDCDVAMPDRVSSDQYQRIQACIIQERVYVLLYSASSTMKSSEQREQAIAELNLDLDNFETFQSQADPEDPMSGWRGKPFLNLEMKFIYHQLRVMVLRCSEKAENKQRCLAESRQSMIYISKIRLAKTTIGGSMVLRRYDMTKCLSVGW